MKDITSQIAAFIETLTTIIVFIVGVGSLILFAKIVYEDHISTQKYNNNNTIEITTTDSCKYTIVPCGKSFIMVPMHDKK